MATSAAGEMAKADRALAWATPQYAHTCGEEANRTPSPMTELSIDYWAQPRAEGGTRAPAP